MARVPLDQVHGFGQGGFSVQVIEQYAGRWSIEDTFKNVKQHLAGHTPQSWKHKGPERTAAFSLWLYSLVWLWHAKNVESLINVLAYAA